MSFASSLKVGDAAYTYYPVSAIEGAEKLPFSLTVLLENASGKTKLTLPGKEGTAVLARKVD